jgi:hypothetical protein
VIGECRDGGGASGRADSQKKWQLNRQKELVMGVRYDSEAVDEVLDVLAKDGHPEGALLRLRRDVLAGDPAAEERLYRFAVTAGVAGKLGKHN